MKKSSFEYFIVVILGSERNSCKRIVEHTRKVLFQIYGFMKICRYFIDNSIN